MSEGRVCISVCGATANEVHDLIRQAESRADVIEIRFDCLDPREIQSTIEHARTSTKPLIITYRPASQGGRRDLSRAERIGFWKAVMPALGGTDYLVDHEFDLDIPFDPDRTIISLHDFDGSPSDLLSRYENLVKSDAATVKIAIHAEDAVDGLDVWKLLGNASVVPIAMGNAGKWTRILGLAYGAAMTYASIDKQGETAPGQITAEDLIDVYRVKELDASTDVYGVLAGDSSYSLSPYMHNPTFKQAGLNAVFIPFTVKDLDAFIRRMVRRESREVELNFRGFSITNPHKQSIIKHLDSIDETARKIGAVNTVKIDGNKLRGFNTDAPGFIAPLKVMHGDLNGAKVIVVGAGGAARACIYALQEEGAEVGIMVREPEKASDLAREFDIKTHRLMTDEPPTATDILVNATPLGTKGERQDETVFTAGELVGVKLVYDLVYNPAETRLIREAKAAGAKTLGGMDMLIAQGARQIKIWTGGDAPVEEMRGAVTKRMG